CPALAEQFWGWGCPHVANLQQCCPLATHHAIVNCGNESVIANSQNCLNLVGSSFNARAMVLAPKPQEGEMARVELQWQSVDTDTLSGELKTKYQSYQLGKRAFEEAMQKAIGCDLAFSYKRGELSIARVERKV